MVSPKTGMQEHIDHKEENKRREAAKKKEILLDRVQQLREDLTIGEDPRFQSLEKMWLADRNVSQGKMLTSLDTNEVFAARGLYGAYTIVLEWRNTIKANIKSINNQIHECDLVINPLEDSDKDTKGRMDMTDIKPAG